MAKGPRKDKAPTDETKADKFKRLASKRTSKAIKAVDNIGSLFSKAYEFTPAQVASIQKYLTEAWAAAYAKAKTTLEGGSTTATGPKIEL